MSSSIFGNRYRGQVVIVIKHSVEFIQTNIVTTSYVHPDAIIEVNMLHGRFDASASKFSDIRKTDFSESKLCSK